jgi:hypothetical protein
MKNGQRTRRKKKKTEKKRARAWEWSPPTVVVGDLEDIDTAELEVRLADYLRSKALAAQGRSSVALHMDGITIVPIEEHVGDVAELVDADGKPIPDRGYSPQPPDISTWWVKCSSKDGKLVWMMPYAAWQVHRDIAASKWYHEGWHAARARMAERARRR